MPQTINLSVVIGDDTIDDALSAFRQSAVVQFATGTPSNAQIRQARKTWMRERLAAEIREYRLRQVVVSDPDVQEAQ